MAKDVDDADPFSLGTSMAVLTLIGAEAGVGTAKFLITYSLNPPS